MRRAVFLAMSRKLQSSGSPRPSSGFAVLSNGHRKLRYKAERLFKDHLMVKSGRNYICKTTLCIMRSFILNLLSKANRKIAVASV